MSVARRVKQNEAQTHFEAGGSVLVSEHGHEVERIVGAGTVTHSRETTTWTDLVTKVREWRNRYPNQRFYVIDPSSPTNTVPERTPA